MIAYDLDGVLAESPQPSVLSWGKMNGIQRKQRKFELLKHYQSASLLFTPPEPAFYVISARRAHDDVYNVTDNWLMGEFGGRILGLFLLPMGRTIQNVIGFKSAVLKQIGATEFTEDNVDVLKGVRKLNPTIKLWLFESGIKKEF